MKELPILFSTPMVQAILEGRKTETRRVVKTYIKPGNYRYDGTGPEAHHFLETIKDNHEPGERYINIGKCPYGQPGDVLWVRENYLKPPTITYKMLRDGADTWPKFDYQADISATEIEQYKSWGWKLKPSIHMPKAAARIWLQVQEIKVERLEDITEDGAIAEGVERIRHPLFSGYINYCNETLFYYEAKYSFISLWESINGPHSWAANPWVWVVKFKLLSTTGKPQFLNQ